MHRSCPTCGNITQYRNLQSYSRAVKKNSLCNSCAQKGNIPWNKGKRGVQRPNKTSFKKGQIPWNRGKKVWTRNNPHPFQGKHHTEEAVKKMREAKFGKKRGPETIKHRRNQRLAAIARIERTKGQVSPRYNPKACKLIDEYGKQHGYSFRHAENGGEFHIKELGYWVDGYDAKKNVVIEVYEPKHQLRAEKDRLRKEEIVGHLGCQFIEIYL